MKKHWLFLIIVSIIILLDQVTKILITSNFILGESLEIIPSFFYLTYVQNTGGGFSILSNHTLLLTLISITAVGILGYLWIKEEKKNILNLLGYSFLIGGTIGNLIDRIVHQYIIDFFSFVFGSYSFPVFNVGDIAIVMGVILLIIELLVGEMHEKN